MRRDVILTATLVARGEIVRVDALPVEVRARLVGVPLSAAARARREREAALGRQWLDRQRELAERCPKIPEPPSPPARLRDVLL